MSSRDKHFIYSLPAVIRKKIMEIQRKVREIYRSCGKVGDPPSSPSVTEEGKSIERGAGRGRRQETPRLPRFSGYVARISTPASYGWPARAIFVAAKECLFLPVVIGAARYVL